MPKIIPWLFIMCYSQKITAFSRKSGFGLFVGIGNPEVRKFLIKIAQAEQLFKMTTCRTNQTQPGFIVVGIVLHFSVLLSSNLVDSFDYFNRF